MYFRIFFFLIWIGISAVPAHGQWRVLESSTADDVLNTYRPRIDISADGKLAIAWEALYMLEESEEWRIDYQLINPSGAYVAPAGTITPPTPCGEGVTEQAMQHVEVLFGESNDLRAMLVYKEWGEQKWGSNGYQQVFQAQITGSEGELENWLATDKCAPIVEGLSQPRFAFLQDKKKVLAHEGILRSFSGVDPASVGGISESLEFDGLTQIPEWSDVAASRGHLARTWAACSDTVEGHCVIQVQVGTSTGSSPFLKASSFRVDEGDFGSRASRPAIALNSKGEGVVSWIDYRSGPEGAVYVQRFDANGVLHGNNIQVSQGTTSINWQASIRPEVALLENGRFMVVWTDSTSEGYRALGRSFDSNGVHEGNAYVLDSDNAGPTMHPDIATDGNSFAVVWLGDDNGRRAVFYSKNYHAQAAQNSVAVHESPQPFSFTTAPNPFAVSTTLQFKIEEPVHVTLSLFDVLGRLHSRYVDKVVGQGVHRVDIDAAHLPAGIYVARLTSEGRTYARLLVHTP